MKGPSLFLALLLALVVLCCVVLCCVVLCCVVLCCVVSFQIIQTASTPVNIDSNHLHFLSIFACDFYSSGGGCERPCLDQETKVRRF